jgi:hypothetical protein
MQKPAPDELFVSNISRATAGPELRQPIALLSPKLDGAETTYFEWMGAGTLEIRETAGAMHRTDRRPALLTLVQFGFDEEQLFVRVDAGRPLVDLLAEGHEISLKFLDPPGVRFSVSQIDGRLTGRFWDRRPLDAPVGTGAWRDRGPGHAMVAAGTILELSLPTRDLGVEATQPVAFFVAVYDDGVETERHPEHRPIELTVPDALFEARNWRA